MIDFCGVFKAFGSDTVLHDVTFKINDGERVGIVGPNGAGKSTLFHLLTGELNPDKGTISLPSKTRMCCLHQHVLHNIDPDISLLDYTADAIEELRTVRSELHRLEALNRSEDLNRRGDLERRFEALGGYRLETDAKIALAGLGFKPGAESRPMREFSGGWQMRAALARTLIAAPDLLLLDEPSNYLDVPAIEYLDKYLISFHGTLLLISHDRFLLRTLVNTILEINCGTAVRYAGGYEYYQKERLERAELAANRLKNFRRERERLQNVVERFRYKAGKAAMAQATIKQIARMDADAPDAAPERMQYAAEIVLPPPPPSGVTALNLHDVGFYYKDQDFIFRHLTLEIPKGEKVAVVGYNGMGKTTLLRAVAGVTELKEGTRELGHNIKIGYQSQEFSDVLPPDNTVLETVRAAADKEMPSQQLRNILGAFGFGGTAAEKQIKVLSGGEKIRVCFARIFVHAPNFLILDEPTTHLDIQARETLQSAVNAYAGTCLFVSHDIEFLRNTATHIIAITEQGVKRYFGTYDDYLRKRAEESAAPENAPANEKSDTEKSSANLKEQRRLRAQKRTEMGKQKRQIENQIAETERIIENAEAEQQKILESLANANASTDFQTLNRRQKELHDLIQDRTHHWEELTDFYTAFMEEYKAIGSSE